MTINMSSYGLPITSHWHVATNPTSFVVHSTYALMHLDTALARTELLTRSSSNVGFPKSFVVHSKLHTDQV